MREDFEFRNSALMNLYPQIVSMRDVETENESFLDSSGNEIVIDNKKVEEEILKLKALKPMQLFRAERNIKLKEYLNQVKGKMDGYIGQPHVDSISKYFSKQDLKDLEVYLTIFYFFFINNESFS